MSVAEDSALLELLPDGIAGVEVATGLWWPRNPAMRALLRGDHGVALAQLLPLPAMRDRLGRGDVVEVQIGDGVWQLRLLSASQPRWLLAQDATANRGLQAQLQAAARARALGDLAHGVVHELGNCLNAAIGMAEQLQALAPASDRDYLGTMMEGARQGAGLLRTLARQLRTGRRRVGSIDVDAMVSQVVAVCAKPIAQRGVELRWQQGAGLRVRGVAEDLELALLQGLLRASANAVAGDAIVVVTQAVMQPLAGGRLRHHGAVRIGAERPWISAVGVSGAGASGFDTDLLQSALLLRRSGGDLRIEADDGMQWLVLELPLEVR